jgi:hypothetical protein
MGFLPELYSDVWDGCVSKKQYKIKEQESVVVIPSLVPDQNKVQKQDREGLQKKKKQFPFMGEKKEHIK